MNKKETVLVCVTPQQSSEKLVEAGRTIASDIGANIEVISVLPLDSIENKNIKILDSLYETAFSAGGEMAVYFSDEPVLTIIAHLAKTQPSCLVVGFPGENSNGLVSTVRLLLPKQPICMVDGQKLYNILPSSNSQPLCVR